ncbi:hypothetical protein B0H13DRAFT_1872752 [Mycena leptocephala]|nr:hypothetical protein B0H13DRAFT_1872752 [Mycena leptocephala]
MSEPPTHHDQQVDGQAPSRVPARFRRPAAVQLDPVNENTIYGNPPPQNENMAIAAGWPAESPRQIFGPHVRNRDSTFISSDRFPPYSPSQIETGNQFPPPVGVFDTFESVPLSEHDAQTYRELINEMEADGSSQNDFSSSPSYPLSAIPEPPFSAFMGGSSSPSIFQSSTLNSDIHSPQAVYPNSSSISSASSIFGFSHAFTSHGGTPDSGTPGSIHTPPSPLITVEVLPIPHHLLLQPAAYLPEVSPSAHSPDSAPPPRGSLADMRNPARRGFLEPSVLLHSSSPSLATVIRALRGLATPGGQFLNQICRDLADRAFDVAWSRTMVEVSDPTYSSIANGYLDVGPLRDHLQSSPVVLTSARENTTSRNTFELRNIIPGTPLFVIYIFQPEIRQALIIERIPPLARTVLSQLNMQDVAAWAGMNPATYSNNPAVSQSADNRKKEASLLNFLAICFSSSLAADWDSRQSADQDLFVGGAAVSKVKRRIAPFMTLAGPYKSQRFEEC